MLSLTNNPDGYPTVTLRVLNVKQTPTVHRLVAKTFIANPYNLPEVNHKDGVKTNNFASNLEWSTGSDNVKHAYALDLVSRVGTKNPSVILSEAQVLEIRELQGHETGTYLASYYGVGKSTIYKIWNREIWKHI